MIILNGRYTTATIYVGEGILEPQCRAQVQDMINHPAFTNHVRVMPDTHAGKGSVIGFTMAMSDKVIPNVVGVDVDCGMLTRRFAVGMTGLLGIDNEKVDENVRNLVPFGMDVHKTPLLNMEKDFPWSAANHRLRELTMKFNKDFNTSVNMPLFNIEWFENKCKLIDANYARVINSIGTLGGGNHFIEFGRDEDGHDYVTIHTGSRNFGKCICDYWQGVAREKTIGIKSDELKKAQQHIIKTEKDVTKIGPRIEELRSLPKYKNTIQKGLEYLEGQDAYNYLADMVFCQMYATTNRQYIMNNIFKAVRATYNDAYDLEIQTDHNYISFDDWIIRKGAIASYDHRLMIIPFNMRDGILICEGKSNSDWNFSAPHGAGRMMSRSAAKENLRLDTFKEQMEGIFSTSVCRSTIDEAPDAYKDSGIIERAIEPTAKIVNRIKPVHNMKDSSTAKDYRKRKKEKKDKTRQNRNEIRKMKGTL